MRKKLLFPFLITVTGIIVIFLIFNELEVYFTSLLSSMQEVPMSYTGVSFLVLASDILLPIPSSIVMYTNGYVLGIVNGALLSLCSLVVSAVIGYYLGKATSWGIKAKADEEADRLLAKYGILAILMTRGIPILSESICLVCGYNRLPFQRYILFNIVGYLPVCLLYAVFGSLGYSQEVFLISFGCSLVIAAVFWLMRHKFSKI